MTNKENSQTKIKRQRSTAYPAISIEEAILLNSKIIVAYPNKGIFDRKAAVNAIGFQTISGASTPRVAALVHYGLLEKDPKGYKTSDLSERIAYPESDKEKTEAIVEAVKHPKLFNALIDNYANKSLPEDKVLGSILIRSHGINPKVSKKVTQIFKDSIEFAGIYKNNTLKIECDGFEEEKEVSKNQRHSTEESLTKPKQPLSELQMYDTHLPSGAIISCPSDIAFYLQIDPAYTDALRVLNDAISAVQKAVQEKGNKTKENEAQSDEITAK